MNSFQEVLKTGGRSRPRRSILADNGSSIDTVQSGSILRRGDEESIQVAEWSVAKVDFNDGGRNEDGTAYGSG